MTTPLSSTRCYNHGEREAVARCPSCDRFFCRECVNDYGGRLLCPACTAAQLKNDPGAQRLPGRAGRLLRLFAGLLFCWLVFYLLGLGLLAIPSRFHDGSIWHVEKTR